jgi:TolB-like protein/tetratricopeptide (TPR) repeat protein
VAASGGENRADFGWLATLRSGTFGRMAGAVFISYASQDTEAARRICEALRSGGVEVWFDQEGGLEHGDAWDAKIRTQIRECVLFVPIVSANTQARHEGYFRIEWELAADRAMGIAQGIPFILPIAVDGTREAGALVPDRFLKVQWTRLPGGAVTPEVRGRLLKLWSHRVGVISNEERRSGAETSPTVPAPSAAVAKSGTKTFAIAAASIVVLGAIASGWLLAVRNKSAALLPAAVEPAQPPPGTADAEPAHPLHPQSVAVLAFNSPGTEKEDEYLSDGISEDLLDALARVPGTKVAARTSSFYFKGRQVPIGDIAKQLGVAYVVKGTFSREGVRVRIGVQLISASDGAVVWSDNFDREIKDLASVGDEIAGRVAKGLQLRLPGRPRGERTSIDPEAYRLFLAGRSQAERPGAAELKDAISCFQQAVALSPNFASAWAALGKAEIQLARCGGIELSVAYDQARTAAAKAAALEPDSPDVLVALGWVHRTAEWDWKAALKAFRRAIELEPDNAESLADASILIFNVGRTDEGIEMASHAADLDPLNSADQLNLSRLFEYSGKMNKAEQAARRGLALAPDGQRYHGLLAVILAELGHPQKADDEVSLETDEIARHMGVAYIAIFRNQRLRAAGQARQIEAQAQDRRSSADAHSVAAEIYASIGEKDLAFAALDKAVAERDPACAWYRENFFLQNLHGDPRWPILLKRIGLTDEQLN